MNWIAEIDGNRNSSFQVKTVGRSTIPWTSNLKVRRSTSGTPAWLTTKWISDGVTIPKVMCRGEGHALAIWMRSIDSNGDRLPTGPATLPGTVHVSGEIFSWAVATRLSNAPPARPNPPASTCLLLTFAFNARNRGFLKERGFLIRPLNSMCLSKTAS